MQKLAIFLVCVAAIVNACDQGQYDDGAGHCPACTCTAGNYCPSGSTNSTSSCVACPAGSSCAGGGGVPQVCAAGSYSASGASTCTACTAAAGSYCPAGSTSASGTSCPAGSSCAGGSADQSACAAGYSSSSGASTCTVCAAGSYSASGASTCTACTAAAGSYCPAGSTSASGTSCPAGSSCAGGSADKIACTTGYFSASGASTCTAWQTCTSSQCYDVNTIPSTTVDVHCFNTAMTGCQSCSSATTCVACQLGVWQTGTPTSGGHPQAFKSGYFLWLNSSGCSPCATSNSYCPNVIVGGASIAQGVAYQACKATATFTNDKEATCSRCDTLATTRMCPSSGASPYYGCTFAGSTSQAHCSWACNQGKTVLGLGGCELYDFVLYYIHVAPNSAYITSTPLVS